MNNSGSEKKDEKQNIQEGFLNNARREKAGVTVYLLSGVKLSGRIRSFDRFSLILESNHQEQLIFKHAISTIVTHHAAAPSTAPQSATEG